MTDPAGESSPKAAPARLAASHLVAQVTLPCEAFWAAQVLTIALELPEFLHPSVVAVNSFTHTLDLIQGEGDVSRLRESKEVGHHFGASIRPFQMLVFVSFHA